MVEVPASHSAYVSQPAPGHALRSSPATRARGSSTSATAGSPALDPLVGFAWVISRPVRQTATNQPVGIVAAIGHALARDGLTSWIDAAHVCAEWTVDPLLCEVLPEAPRPAGRGVSGWLLSSCWSSAFIDLHTVLTLDGGLIADAE